MVEFTFSAAQIAAFFLRGLLAAAPPFILFAYLRKKHGGRFYPVLVGAVAMILLAVPRGLFRSIAIQGQDSFLVRFLIADIIGAIFEEGARYIAMTHAMPHHDTPPDALCYGLGHGGVELFSTAANQFGFWMLASQNSGRMLEAESQLATQLQTLSGQGALEVVDILFAMPCAMVFQLALSLLIFTAVHNADCRKYLPIAIGIHALGNLFFSTVLSLLFTAAVCYYVYRVRKDKY